MHRPLARLDPRQRALVLNETVRLLVFTVAWAVPALLWTDYYVWQIKQSVAEQGEGPVPLFPRMAKLAPLLVLGSTGTFASGAWIVSQVTDDLIS